MTNFVMSRIGPACMAAVIAASAACGDSPGVRSAGLVSSPSAAFAVRVAPLSMPLIPMPLASCPMTQPFTTTFDLFLSASSDEVLIDGVTLRFLDGSGASSRLFFTATDLTRMFGDIRIAAGTHRTFTLQPRFGCGLSTPRSISVIVDVVEVHGGRHQSIVAALLE